MRNIIRATIFFLFLFPSIASAVELPVRFNDSTFIQERSFDHSKIEEYKADDTYDYGIQQSGEQSLWDRIKRWIVQFLRGLFYLGTSTPVGQFIMYVILIVVAVLVILRLLKVDSQIGFYRTKRSIVVEKPKEENIHGVDFEQAISLAVKSNDFREAIRLHYLFALKKLSDKNLVRWVPGKTNREYTNELGDENLKKGFRDLSYYFDYTWYGHFDATAKVYSRVEQLFNHWEKELN